MRFIMPGSKDKRGENMFSDKGQLKCSFCGKLQDQVKKLVAGPGVYICDECIELCNEIIEEELSEDLGLDVGDIPKPKEIKEILDQYVIGQESAKSPFLLRFTTIIKGLISAVRSMMLSCRRAI